jgi:hypothetical protein
MNLLQNGLEWLSRKQEEFVSSPVIYCRDNKHYPVDAVLGRTKYDIVDENGFRVSGHSIDFLIPSSRLELIPVNGDQIISHDLIYEVIDLGEGCWQWCDPHGITRRIHTTIYKERS